MKAGLVAIRLPLRTWSPAPDDQNGRIHPGRRPERVTGDGAPAAEVPAAVPAPRPGSRPVGVAPDDGPLQDEVGGHEPGFGSEEEPEQRARDRIRRAGHHPERPVRKPQRRGISLDHRDTSRADPSQAGGPADVGLDRDDPRSGADQGMGESPLARTDVEDQVSRPYAGVGDNQGGPLVS